MTTASPLSFRVRGKLRSLLVERPILQVQLAILYSGFFLCLLAVVLGAAGVLLIRGSQSRASGGGAPSPAPPASVLLVGAIGVVATVIALAGAWWLAGRFLRPLRAMTATADAISATNLHQRLDLRGPDDELTHLGRTLNGLFARLEAAFESQRRFVANASHELRTPLAGQRAVLQVALGDPNRSVESLSTACEQALALGSQQARLIDALLTLATSERGIEEHASIDLAEVVAEAIATRAQLASDNDIRIDTTLSPTPTTGDPTLASLWVTNLVDNALRHNHRGGTVSIFAAPGAGGATVTIANTGPLVPEITLSSLFEPFRTTSADRTRLSSGHGLGLAIVHAAVRAHGGAIEASARAAGGLEVTVKLPPS